MALVIAQTLFPEEQTIPFGTPEVETPVAERLVIVQPEPPDTGYELSYPVG